VIFLLSNPLTQPLQAFLVWLNGVVETAIPLPDSISSWALAIIIVALIVKVATQPLTSKQQASMRKMQALQPKINELQKKYKDDREGLSKAQMELYKEEGVNPFGGCLPLLVQMVVLFGMWRAVMGLAGTPADPGPLMGQQFLWVPSLGLCEPSPMCGKEFSLLPVAIPLLLITMVVSQIIYQRLMTPPARSNDAQQQAMSSMMKFMPLLFAWIFIKFPAGLVLYYATFNVVGLVQQTWINRRVEQREAREAAEAEAEKKARNGKSAPARLAASDGDAGAGAVEDDGASSPTGDQADDGAAVDTQEEPIELRKSRQRKRRKKDS
jgi:YidC/Oxa1 family membrane protein insertase